MKKSLQQLGPLRDAQVQLKAARTQLELAKGMAGFITRLRKRERRLRRSAAVQVRQIRTKGIEKHISSLCRKIRTPLPDADPDHFLSTLNSVGDSMFAAVVVRLRALNTHNPRTFHRLRIRFKKFRYLLEFLQPTLSIPDDPIEAMKPYQDALGEIQDLTVLIEAIEDFSENHGPRGATEAAGLLRKLNDSRDVRMQAFLQNPETVFDFWKSVPVRLQTDESETSRARPKVRRASAGSTGHRRRQSRKPGRQRSDVKGSVK